MYADKVTPEMQAAIDEVERRRAKQLAYNAEHGITPETIRKAIRHGIELEIKANRTEREAVGAREPKRFRKDEAMRELEEEMLAAAGALEFEKAARLRDQLKKVEALPEIDGMAEEPAEEEKPRPKAGMPGTRAGRGKKGRK
jgi:excinuclease ABC subunit B